MNAALDWRTAPVPFIAGLGDTRLETAQPYAVRPLGELMASLTPYSVPKNRAPAFLPSLYAANDARSHAAQKERGRFVALVGDIDEGDCPLGQVEAAVDKLGARVARTIYSTASAHPDGKRWRLIVPLGSALSYDDWRDAQLALVDHMAGEGIKLDTCAARPGQISYLPNVPNDARAPDGEPWFFECASSDLDAPGLPVASGVLAGRIEAIRERRITDDRERERIKAEAFTRAARRAITTGQSGSMIESFNQGNSVATLLERYGYTRSPRHGEDWRSRMQTSDSFATRIIEGDKWISLSGSDAAAGLGERCAAGCFGDAFDLFAFYEHGNDRRTALRELHREREGSAPPDASQSREDLETVDPETGEINSPSSVAKGWAEPIDLWAHYSAPEMPRGLLPDLIERFAFKHSEVMGADPAGLAMAALAVCATAISDNITVQVKRNDPTWRESCRMWVGLVGPPSRKKTPILKAALRPLRRLDGNLMAEYLTKLHEYEALSSDQRKASPRPKQKRLVISDSTVEAAQEVMRDSPDGIMSEQDELSGWFGAMDKYAPGKGAQADRAFWLKAFNGGTYNLNRISRGAIQIPNLSINLLGGIQPEPLRKIANDTVDDGLVQRLLPVILRPASVGRDVPADDVIAEYERLIERLYLMKAPERAISAGPSSYGPPAVRFDDRARAVRERLEIEHLALVEALEVVSPKLAAHYGKYDGLFARLCLLWHCIDNAASTYPPAEISQDTAEKVAGFMQAFVRPSAVAFYAGMLGVSAGHEDLIALASWIVAKQLDEVRARDAQGSSQSLRHHTAEQVRALFEKLEAFGWLERGEPAPKSNTPRWIVNPRVHEVFADRARHEQQRRANAREALRAAFRV